VRRARCATARAVTRTALALAAPLAPLASLAAQDRLLGLRAAGAGVTAETVWFGDGVAQAGLLGGDSLRVTRVSQLSVPITAVTPIGSSWTLDATTVYATGSVQLAGAAGGPRRCRGSATCDCAPPGACSTRPCC
jgi:hypothetical protein